MSAMCRCDGCGETVDRPKLRLALTIHARSGHVFRDFCSDECLIGFLEHSIEQRAAAAATPPTPLTVAHAAGAAR